MPIYTWVCDDKDCNHVTEIVRPMADYQVPPDNCDKCNKTAMSKIIEPVKKEQISKVWGGKVPWHDEAYSPTKPIR